MAVTKIGDATINRVEEHRIPNKISYFTDDEELIAVNRYWLSPHFLDENGGFDLVFQSWTVEVGGQVFLIDPCHGNGKQHPVPFFNMLDVPYIERMQASGYRPQDIDFVVCTHLHHDHCGWNTELRDGKWVPTFPKARYIIQKLEYDRLAASHRSLPADDLNLGVFERSVEPVAKAGLIDFAAGNRVLTSSISVEAAPGHTLGHQMLHLQSAGQHAFFTGDCFHHPIQLAEPTVIFAGSDDQAALISTRRRLVDLSVEFDAPLIAAHAPAPYGVRATRAGRVLHFSAGL
jgi:glyoxylase-like metal-dependent hydrolase (beta-lactamase superfamily II)